MFLKGLARVKTPVYHSNNYQTFEAFQQEKQLVQNSLVQVSNYHLTDKYHYIMSGPTTRCPEILSENHLS